MTKYVGSNVLFDPLSIEYASDGYIDPFDFDSGLTPASDWTAAYQWANDQVVANPALVGIAVPHASSIAGTVFIDRGVSMRGRGRNFVIDLTAAAARFETRDFLTLTGGAATASEGYRGGRLEGFTLDGGNVADHGLRIFGRSYTMNDVMIRDCVDIGLWTEFAGTGSWPDESNGTEWTRIELINNRGGNWEHYGPGDSYISGLEASIDSIGAVTGITNVLFGSGAFGMQFENSHIWGGSSDYGIWVQPGAAAGRFNNITSEGAKVAQLRVELNGGGMIGENLHLFGQGTGVQSGLMLSGVRNARLSGRVGSLAGGSIVHDGAGGTIGSGNGDFGGNYLSFTGGVNTTTDPFFTGAIHNRTAVNYQGFDGPLTKFAAGAAIGFGVTPIDKQETVPVNAAGIHAALVNLGLIDGTGGEVATVLRHAETIGDGVNTVYTVTHNLGTTDIGSVMMWETATGDAKIADWSTNNDLNVLTITLGAVATVDQYRVVILA